MLCYRTAVFLLTAAVCVAFVSAAEEAKPEAEAKTSVAEKSDLEAESTLGLGYKLAKFGGYGGYSHGYGGYGYPSYGYSYPSYGYASYYPKASYYPSYYSKPYYGGYGHSYGGYGHGYGHGYGYGYPAYKSYGHYGYHG